MVDRLPWQQPEKLRGLHYQRSCRCRVMRCTTGGKAGVAAAEYSIEEDDVVTEAYSSLPRVGQFEVKSILEIKRLELPTSKDQDADPSERIYGL